MRHGVKIDVRKMDKGFVNMHRNDVIEYIKETYEIIPEYMFKSDPECCVFQHRHSNKWFGIIMNISADKVGLGADTYIDVLNVKCDPEMVAVLNCQFGFAPAYHMNKKHWLTILLDGGVSNEQIAQLLNISYELTKKR